MKYAVVVPAFNEAENLPRLAASLETAAAGRTLDLVLVDNGSTDGTREVASKRGLRVIRPPERRRIAQLRNLGAAQTRGELIVFLDADMEVPADYFDLLDAAFADERVAAIGVVEEVPREAPWFASVWSRRTLARREGAREVDFLPGRNIAVRRRAFDAVGGFSTELETSEDKDFVLRLKTAGLASWSLVHSGMRHWGYERSLAEWVRKEFWRQRSHIAMIARHGVTPRLVRFPFLCLGHLAAAVLALGSAPFAPPAALACLAALCLPSLWLALSKRESRRDPGSVLAFTLLYATRFVVGGVAILSEGTQALARARA